jgi:hypothetical protein
MKKFVTTGLVSILTLSSISWAYAWGLMAPNFTYDQSDLNQVVESIKDEAVKDIVSKNLLPASQNNINEDWDFNNKNYYSKKLTLSVSIPDALKEKISSVYISLWVAQNTPMPMYDAKMSTSTDTSTNSKELKIDLNKDSLPTEVKLTRAELDKFITDQYGASFNGKLVLELTDGTQLPYSNMVYLYMSKDNTDGKIAHLSNLYYSQNPSAGWANTADLLKKAFEKLQAKYPKTYDYISILEKVSKKIDSKIESIKTEQNKLVESIRGEEDFPKLVDPASKLADKSTILNDIKYQVASEIKTKQSEGIIDEIFAEDSK